jgi:hypothetical protein
MSETFARDLASTLALSDDQLAEIGEKIPVVCATFSAREEDLAIENLATSLTIADNLQPVTVIARHFLREFSHGGDAEKDSVDDLTADLVTLGLLPDDRRVSFAVFLEKLQKAAREWYSDSQLRIRTARRSMPIVTGIDMAANFRPIFRDEFYVDTDIETYQPKCSGLVAIGTVTLRLSQLSHGSTKEVSFQLDARSLQLFIDHLRALQIQLLAAEEALGLKVSTKHEDSHDR